MREFISIRSDGRPRRKLTSIVDYGQHLQDTIVMMRIDAHQHYWDPEVLHYFWMPPEPGLLRRKYLPEDLEPIYQRHHIDGSIVVQAAQVPEEAQWLLDLADRHSSILGVVAWVDLTIGGLGRNA